MKKPAAKAQPTAKSSTPKKPTLKWVCVFEVDDSQNPRRHPAKPHVRVEAMSIKPGRDLDAWVAKSRRAKKKGIVRVLNAEMPKPENSGGFLRPFRYPEQKAAIKTALTTLREQLRCRRYTVDGEQRTWRLYVIELDATKIPKMPSKLKGAVYVGETSLPAEERAKQHREGTARSRTGQRLWNKPCHQYYKQLKMKWVPQQFSGDYFCESAAKIAETKMRLYFEAKDFKVYGGKDRLDRLKKKAGKNAKDSGGGSEAKPA